MKELYIFLLLAITSFAIAQSSAPGLPPPIGAQKYDLYNCEEDTDGYSTFNLASMIPAILGSAEQDTGNKRHWAKYLDTEYLGICKWTLFCEGVYGTGRKDPKTDKKIARDIMRPDIENPQLYCGFL